MHQTSQTVFPGPGGQELSAVLLRPRAAICILVLAHGAGAGMRHVFMEGLANALAERDVATFRFQFPYTEAGRRRPDPPKVLMATIGLAIGSAIRAVAELGVELPVFAGGKSMGGRMTSTAVAQGAVGGLRGIVFFGFPLHAPGKPGDERATHLADVDVPMLFIQGTRDRLADLGLLEPVIAELGPRASLHIVEGGDHSFKVPKRSGRTESDVLGEIAGVVRDWLDEILAMNPTVSN